MVYLTMDMIARGTSGYTKKKRDESMQHYLKRLTHLYLEERNIDEVGDDLASCRNLIVLYLYDNKLSRLPNLNQNQHLTHLYLQNNNISRLENLAGLQKLSKLYVGGNVITVVEGLEKLSSLQELHIEQQRLPPGEKLLFDPRTVVALGLSLQVLNVSGNNLDSIIDLEPLSQLTQFMANDNQLNDMRELAHCLTSWRHIWRLELMGNPLCHKTKYRDRIIIMSNAIEVLDGKEINETARRFIQNWHASKEERRRKRDMMSRRNTQTEQGMGLDPHNLPPVSAPPKHGNVPSFMMPGLPRKQFQELLARSSSMVQDDVAIHAGGDTYGTTNGTRKVLTMSSSAPVVRPSRIHLHVGGTDLLLQDIQQSFAT